MKNSESTFGIDGLNDISTEDYSKFSCSNQKKVQ